MTTNNRKKSDTNRAKILHTSHMEKQQSSNTILSQPKNVTAKKDIDSSIIINRHIDFENINNINLDTATQHEKFIDYTKQKTKIKNRKFIDFTSKNTKFVSNNESNSPEFKNVNNNTGNYEYCLTKEKSRNEIEMSKDS